MKIIKTISIILVFAFMLSFFGCKGAKGPGGNSDPAGAEQSDVHNGESVSEEEGTTEEEKNIIKIGVLAPQNGAYAENGRLEILGIKYAHQKKPSIKIDGKVYEIELVFSGNINSRKKVKKEAQKLIDAGVSAVIGGCNGSYALSTAELFKEKSIPFVSMYSLPLKLSENSKNTFSLSADSEYTGKKLAVFSMKKLKTKSAYILCALGDDSAEETAFFFAQQFRSLGGKVKIKSFDPSETNFTSYAAEAYDYDCLFAAAPLSLSKQIISAAESYGTEIILSTSLWNSEKVFDELRDVSVDLFICTNLKYSAKDKRCTKYVNWVLSDPALSKQSGNLIISGISFGAIDAYNAVYSSIRSANSLSGEKIIRALSKTARKGITGNISFDTNGSREQSAAFYNFNNTKTTWEKVSTKEKS